MSFIIGISTHTNSSCPALRFLAKAATTYLLGRHVDHVLADHPRANELLKAILHHGDLNKTDLLNWRKVSKDFYIESTAQLNQNGFAISLELKDEAVVQSFLSYLEISYTQRNILKPSLNIAIGLNLPQPISPELQDALALLSQENRHNILLRIKNIFYNEAINLNDLLNLPWAAYLTGLVIGDIWGVLNCTDVEWPPLLTHLSFGSLHRHPIWPEELPNTLTDLSFAGVWQSLENPLILPNSLRCLKYNVSWRPINNSFILPESLTHLRLGLIWCETACPIRLPNSLTYLQIGWMRAGINLPEDIPPSLQTIDLSRDTQPEQLPENWQARYYELNS